MSGAETTIRAAFSGEFGSFRLDCRFESPMSGVTALFGPSGSGKTTILRCMAGLEKAAGVLSVGYDVWQDDARGLFRKPHQRAVGYVFQEPSLFPHLSVRGNLLYGAKRAAVNGGVPGIGEAEVVELLGIERFMRRSPDALSGGERQRVAIGRALLSQPRLLLMDEPLAGLDSMAKDEILPYLERLHRHLSIPVLFVSHDISEVERFADRIMLLEGGQVMAMQEMTALASDPASPLLHRTDAAVILQARIERVDTDFGLAHLALPGGVITVPDIRGEPGAAVSLRIGARDVSLALEQSQTMTSLDGLPGRIRSIVDFRGSAARKLVVVALGPDGDGAELLTIVTRQKLEALRLAPGGEVYLQINAATIVA